MSVTSELLKLRGIQPVGLSIGIVVDVSPLTIRLNGDSVNISDVPCDGDYTPAVDDTVYVLRPGPALIVLGKIA